MSGRGFGKTYAGFVYAGLVAVNICAVYLAGGVSIYGTSAFRAYGRMDLFSLIFVIEPLMRSLALFVSGRAGEYFGRKRLYLWSVSAFAVTVAVCSAAPNGTVFLIARSFSGFFWGLFLTNIFAIVNDVFPKEEYSVRIGILQTVTSLIYIVGPILCGIVIEKWGWRVSLGVLLPFLAAGLLLVGVFMPKSERPRREAPVGNSGPLPGEISGGRPGSARMGELFRKKGYTVLIAVVAVYTLVYCTGNYIPLYAQTELKAGVTLSAAVLVPCNVMSMLFSGLSGVYIGKKGCSRGILILMAAAALLGSLLYIGAAVKPGYFLILLSTAILGVGAGIYQVLPFAYVQKYLQKDLVAEATSLIGFVEGAASVAAGLIYSAVMKNGVAFGLAFASVFGVCVFVLAVLKYRQPHPETLITEKRK